MGYNRSGTRRAQRMKRARKELERLIKKDAAQESATPPSQPATPAAKG